MSIAPVHAAIKAILRNEGIPENCDIITDFITGKIKLIELKSCFIIRLAQASERSTTSLTDDVASSHRSVA